MNDTEKQKIREEWNETQFTNNIWANKEVVEKIDLLIQKAEQLYKSAVADQVAPYRHNLENLLELKDTLSNQVGKQNI